MFAMEANCASHASHLHHALAGARVHRPGDVVIADSGLSDDTFNLVCHARFAAGGGSARVADVVSTVQATGRPFSWWVAPTSTPANLGSVLRSHGLPASETEEAMVADLGGLTPQPPPDALTLATVETVAQLRDYAMLMAHNWDPPSPAVHEFFERVAPAVLDGRCASRFVVAYADGEPVAGAEIHLSAGVAGLYGVVTLEAHRGQGFGTAVTRRALELAATAGVGTAVLQASADGAPIYRKLGFTTTGEYTEYAL